MGAMRLPFDPPLAPMLSVAADAIPGGDGWLFEPKWDGFRLWSLERIFHGSF
jgi:ATP-dependent DNA ligase